MPLYLIQARKRKENVNQIVKVRLCYFQALYCHNTYTSVEKKLHAGHTRLQVKSFTWFLSPVNVYTPWKGLNFCRRKQHHTTVHLETPTFKSVAYTRSVFDGRALDSYVCAPFCSFVCLFYAPHPALLCSPHPRWRLDKPKKYLALRRPKYASIARYQV